MPDYILQGYKEILDIHKPWVYTLKRLGEMEFCNRCKDNTGRIYVSYPCTEAKIAMRYLSEDN